MHNTYFTVTLGSQLLQHGGTALVAAVALSLLPRNIFADPGDSFMEHCRFVKNEIERLGTRGTWHAVRDVLFVPLRLLLWTWLLFNLGMFGTRILQLLEMPPAAHWVWWVPLMAFLADVVRRPVPMPSK